MITRFVSLVCPKLYKRLLAKAVTDYAELTKHYNLHGTLYEQAAIENWRVPTYELRCQWLEICQRESDHCRFYEKKMGKIKQNFPEVDRGETIAKSVGII